MGTPPVMDIFVVLPLFRELGPGVDVREVGFDFGLGRPSSETKVPAAEGGGFDGWGGGVADFATGALLVPLLLFDGVEAPDLPKM